MVSIRIALDLHELAFGPKAAAEASEHEHSNERVECRRDFVARNLAGGEALGAVGGARQRQLALGALVDQEGLQPTLQLRADEAVDGDVSEIDGECRAEGLLQ